MLVLLSLGNSPDVFYKVHYIEFRVGLFSPTLTHKKGELMKKRFDFLSLFGDEKKETDAEKIARIEQALADKDTEIAQLKADKSELEKKVNSLKLDGLVRKVEPTKIEVEEDVTFDFDL